MVLKKSNKNHSEKNYDRTLSPSDCSAWLSLCWAFTRRQREQLLARQIGPQSPLQAESGEIQPSSDTGIQEMLSSHFSWLAGCQDARLAPNP